MHAHIPRLSKPGSPHRAAAWLRSSILTLTMCRLGLSLGAAQLVITAPDTNLLPNKANQEVEIIISGSIDLAGLNFSLIIGDGFPDIPGSSIDSPTITSVDLIGSESPTIFTGNNNGQDIPENRPRAYQASVVTDTGTVSGSGLLATVTIDTTGYLSGTYDLTLTGDADNDFSGLEIIDALSVVLPSTVHNGSITVTSVPEPESVAVVAGFGLLLLTVTRKRKAPRARSSAALTTLLAAALMAMPQSDGIAGETHLIAGAHALHPGLGSHRISVIVSGGFETAGVNF